jgi:hypothetical protein
LTDQYYLHDFTEAHYRHVLEEARHHYAFVKIGEHRQSPHVFWRHDVDLSPQRAFRLAQIEHELGVRATYFFMLSSPYYSLLEPAIRALARGIAGLGHDIGLHFDITAHASVADELEDRARLERDILERWLAVHAAAISFHNPPDQSASIWKTDVYAGLPNVYGPSMKQQYHYCSDSNGYWRHERLIDVIKQRRWERLHVLTHPEWWVPDAMSPRERISRCIAGRADAAHRLYDESLRASERKNVGR